MSSPPEPPDFQEVRSLSPEARRRRARVQAQRLGLVGAVEAHDAGRAEHPDRNLPGTQPRGSAFIPRTFEVVRRTAVGTYNDGFIHAGNLAYLSLLAIFPFFILSGLAFQLIGEAEDRLVMIETVLQAMPPTVQQVIEPVAHSVVDARSGWLVWLGAALALWTVTSLVETIRDILRRAYGTRSRRAFWMNRLLSAGLIIGAVVLLLASLFAQVAIGTAVELVDAQWPQLSAVLGTLRLSRVVPALGLFGSIYLLFLTLTPPEYRARHHPKWPGAAFAAAWWIAVTVALPPLVGSFFAYDLTYGRLAGMVIALLFFWLVGLGLVIGAELNAALAEPDADRDEPPDRIRADLAEQG